MWVSKIVIVGYGRNVNKYCEGVLGTIFFFVINLLGVSITFISLDKYYPHDNKNKDPIRSHSQIYLFHHTLQIVLAVTGKTNEKKNILIDKRIIA